MNLVKHQKTPFSAQDTHSPILNNLLGELTNMVWGRFKSHFFAGETLNIDQIRSQVPLIIDQEKRYLTFGGDNPQLCFRYVLHDKKDVIETTSIYQKFVFHLNWTPEKYVEPPELISGLVQVGELEFF